MEDLKDATTRRLSIMQTVSAVLWSFFGVRKSQDHDRDLAQLNPVVVIITGVVAGILFVLLLVMIVKMILN